MVDLVNRIKKKAEEISPELIEYRHKLHSFAECGFELPKTLELVKAALHKTDCKLRKCGRAGLVGELCAGQGKTVLLRADMDALHIKEETGLPYASKSGSMHACGHDIHTAMLIGAIKVLCSFKDKIQGRIIFAFQPAEETLEGAADMISDGLLDEKIDMAMALHVLAGTDLPLGYTVVSSAGISAPSSDFFKITLRGKSAHGGMPSEGADAIACGARIINSIEEIRSRGLGKAEEITVSIGTFNGGTVPNVIAEKAELRGTARAYSVEARDRLIAELNLITGKTSARYKCTSEFEITSSCPPLLNDPDCSERAYRYAKEVFGDKLCALSESLCGKGGGSEDFAYISQRVPSVAIAISAGSRSEGYDAPLHNPKTRLSDDVIRHGTSLLAYSALSYFAEKG